MNVLEKILEEIEKEQNSYEADHAWNYSKGMEYAKEIIRSHMSEKEKVSSAEIISRDIGGKPYYEIKYKKVGEDHYTVGYSSYLLDYVIDWLNNYFEFCGEPKIVVDVGKDKNVPSNDGWIPVEERLPKKPVFGADSYIVQHKCIITPYSAYWDGENWTEDYSDEPIRGIIAWQPLPEAYHPKQVQAAEHIMSRFTRVE